MKAKEEYHGGWGDLIFLHEYKEIIFSGHTLDFRKFYGNNRLYLPTLHLLMLKFSIMQYTD